MPGSEPHVPVTTGTATDSYQRLLQRRPPLATVQLIRWRGERARLERHAPDPDRQHFTTIHPADGRPLSVGFVRHCIELLDGVGGMVMSPALGVGEVRGFEAAGFATRADLHLLVHDLHPIPPRPALRETHSRRGSVREWRDILAVDAAAFPALWHLDGLGLHNALRATPSSRLRVVVGDDEALVGYAITGRAGRRGYLQRLAVAPSAQGAGIGRHLVCDALSWCRRWRVQRVAVNTQHGNARALSLYQNMGFVETPTGLRVLERLLPTSVGGAHGEASKSGPSWV